MRERSFRAYARKGEEMHYTKGWLTVGRACDLRCEWCYARGTGYRADEQMSPALADALLDLCASLSLRHVTLIGGEPTVYSHLLDVLARAREKGLRCAFISNGVSYADPAFVRALYEAGMAHFSISLKGTDRARFLAATGADKFDAVMQGIDNCLALRADAVTVFFVVTEETAEELPTCVRGLRARGVQKFSFSFLYDYSPAPAKSGYLADRRPRDAMRAFTRVYPELHAVTQGRMKISPVLPLCALDGGFLQTIEERGQLSAGCQLRERSGLIFDYDGTLLPCNAMWPVRLGKFGEDFFDRESLLAFAASPRVKEVYDKLTAPPDGACAACSHAALCDACPCQWTNYTLRELLES